MSERGRRLELSSEWAFSTSGDDFDSWLMDKVIAIEETLATHRAEVTNDACGDALQKLWDHIIVARRPDYGDWEYPGQAYRHIKAEFDQVYDALAGVMKLIDEGALVRSMSDEFAAGWAMRQIPLVMALKKAHDALNPKAEVPSK